MTLLVFSTPTCRFFSSSLRTEVSSGSLLAGTGPEQSVSSEVIVDGAGGAEGVAGSRASRGLQTREQGLQESARFTPEIEHREQSNVRTLMVSEGRGSLSDDLPFGRC